MPLLAKKDHQCNRRVNGIRCTIKAETLCAEHIHDVCDVCSREALFECRTCHTPLCPTCICHGSFGH